MKFSKQVPSYLCHTGVFSDLPFIYVALILVFPVILDDRSGFFTAVDLYKGGGDNDNIIWNF